MMLARQSGCESSWRRSLEGYWGRGKGRGAVLAVRRRCRRRLGFGTWDCLLEKPCELAELGLPSTPLGGRGEQVVFHVAEKFHLHDVDFHYRYARYFRPCLIGVGVIVQEFITEHQSDGQEAIFTTGLSPYGRVLFLQPVNEQESKKDDILRHLGG